MEKWCFSTSLGDSGDLMFYGSFESKQAAIDGCRKDHPEAAAFRVGRSVHPLDVIEADVEDILESLECQLADHVVSDCSSVSMPPGNKQELCQMINSYLREHAAFESNCVTDVEEVR